LVRCQTRPKLRRPCCSAPGLETREQGLREVTLAWQLLAPTTRGVVLLGFVTIQQIAATNTSMSAVKSQSQPSLMQGRRLNRKMSVVATTIIRGPNGGMKKMIAHATCLGSDSEPYRGRGPREAGLVGYVEAAGFNTMLL
jgi:hypothetical protein